MMRASLSPPTKDNWISLRIGNSDLSQIMSTSYSTSRTNDGNQVTGKYKQFGLFIE